MIPNQSASRNLLHHRAVTVRPLLMLAVLSVSCAGAVRKGLADETGAAAKSDPPPERLASPVCKQLDPGPAPIRRLNRFEYNNTVRDLLGDTTRPATDFPVENIVLGFDNNAAALTASPALIEDYLGAAERLATFAVENNLEGLVACSVAKHSELGCARRFIRTFGKRAYRRPLTDGDVEILLGVFVRGYHAFGFKGGIRWSLVAMLSSVQFLYRIESGVPTGAGQPVTRLTAWELASRLSYLIWRSMPDAELFAAAEAGRLTTRTEIDTQLSRMLAHPKAHATVADFHEQWLQLQALDDLPKDKKIYPTFKPDIARLLKQEATSFIDDVFWGSEGTLAALYTAPFTYVDAALAKYYGLPVPKGTGFKKVDLKGQMRAGILTQGGLLAVQAQENQTHPVRRGAFVRRSLLCEELPPPPQNVVFQIPPPSPTLTGRERFEEHRSDPACSGCHRLTDPIGFGFENFDGVGLYRTMDNGHPIDASGQVVGMPGGGEFNGPIELAQLLSKSDQAAECMVLSWFRYGYGRGPERGVDDCSLDVLRRSFSANHFKVKDLFVALAHTDAFQYLRVGSGVATKPAPGAATR